MKKMLYTVILCGSAHHRRRLTRHPADPTGIMAMPTLTPTLPQDTTISTLREEGPTIDISAVNSCDAAAIL